MRRTWETTEDIRNGVVYSRPFSREEDAHPYTPHGTNIAIPFLTNLSPEHQPDPIGHVAFAIDQDYGLAPGERKLASVSASAAIDAQRSALPVIGRTGTIAHDYAVSLIESTTDAQGTEYHLGLQPLRDPARHRLRELWVDANTWLPEEAVVEGIGNRGPLDAVRWRVEFRQTDGGTYIARETALAPLQAKHALLHDVSVTFGEVKLDVAPGALRPELLEERPDRRTVIASALVLAALLDTAPAAASPLALSPADALYAAARRARSESAYAHYAVYATVVTFRNNGHQVVETWNTVEDLRRRLVHAHAINREEAAHPHVARGTNIGFGGIGPSGVLQLPPGAMPPKGRTSNPERASGPIGQLSFAVDQDFGLALNAPPIGATANMSDVAATVSTLQKIGRTGTVARTYDVTDLGDLTENGVVVHHLGLRPLRDPRRYRLRELWLDAKTSLPLRAIVAGIGNRRPLDAVDWRVEFKQLEGGTYIARETALAPLDTDDGRLVEVTITFAELRPTNRLTPEESLGLSSSVGTTDP